MLWKIKLSWWMHKYEFIQEILWPCLVKIRWDYANIQLQDKNLFKEISTFSNQESIFTNGNIKWIYLLLFRMIFLKNRIHTWQSSTALKKFPSYNDLSTVPMEMISETVDFIGYIYLKWYSKNLENSKNPGNI